jgi:hypothetical protein
MTTYTCCTHCQDNEGCIDSRDNDHPWPCEKGCNDEEGAA